MRKIVTCFGAAALAVSASARAQTIQSNAYGADITVTSTWQDLTGTYAAMAGATGWVANKSAVPALVVFSASATAPTGGGTVLPANASPLYGNAAHVWVKSLGGTSTVAVGLGSSATVSVSGALSAGGTASSAAPAYSAGSQPLSLDLAGQLRTRVENGADVSMGSTADTAWSSGTGTVISLLKTIAAGALDTTTISTYAIDTTNPGVSNVVAPSGSVVAGEQTYAASSWQPLNLTASGRLKTSAASATNIAPAALATTTTAADLVGCQYNAATLTFATGYTGAVQCDANGRLVVSAAAPTMATDASTNVTATTTSTALLAANTSRLGGNIVNDSAAVLYLKLASGASASSYDYFLAGSVNGVPAQFEIPAGWTGPVYGIWASASGAARVSERTK